LGRHQAVESLLVLRPPQPALGHGRLEQISGPLTVGIRRSHGMPVGHAVSPRPRSSYRSRTLEPATIDCGLHTPLFARPAGPSWASESGGCSAGGAVTG